MNKSDFFYDLPEELIQKIVNGSDDNLLTKSTELLSYLIPEISFGFN